MKFEFEPYVGPLPLRFGMDSAEVSKALGLSPQYSRPPNDYGGARDDYGDLGVNFDQDGKAAEFCFAPSSYISLVYSGTTIIGPGAISDPVSVFKKVDPSPIDLLGFLVFVGIGVNTTGYHDGDKSQRAINVFRKGFWDRVLV